VSDRTLQCDGPSMPASGLGAPEDNLAWRAAERFAEAAGWPTGFAITIDKHIPVGGGLGGGSADAAAVLRGLNAIAPTPLPAAELLAIAGTLGSDVPFLTSDAVMAWTWGRGDRLLTVPPLSPMAATLVTFPDGVNTGAAYAALAAARGGSAHPGAVAYAADAFASWASIAALAANDFERVVPALHPGVAGWLPVVQQAAAMLRAAGEPGLGLLSGSGATCVILHPPDSGFNLGTDDADAALPFGAQLVDTRTASAIVAPEPIF
jgi:4-diphosphocytidyl-2-C-methyl-D-erythritol kinase